MADYGKYGSRYCKKNTQTSVGEGAENKPYDDV